MSEKMTVKEQEKYAQDENAKAKADYEKDPNHPKWKAAGHVSAEKAKDMVGGAHKDEVREYDAQKAKEAADKQAGSKSPK